MELSDYDGRTPEPPYQTPADADFMAAHIEALEADNDALLAVVKAAKEMEKWMSPKATRSSVVHFRDALAALPEHLKAP